MIVGEARAFAVAALKFDYVVSGVDMGHFFGPADNLWQQLAQGNNDVERVDAGTNDVGQQWGEHQVILLVEHNDFGGFGRQQSAQGLSAFGAGKTAAENEDTFLNRVHGCKRHCSCRPGSSAEDDRWFELADFADAE